MTIDKMKNMCIFLLVFFSTMPVVTLPLAGNISLYIIFMILSLAIMLVQFLNESRGIVKIGYPLNLFCYWLAIALMGSVCGFFYFTISSGSEEWLKNDISYIPKILIYFLFLILWSSTYNDNSDNMIIKGFLLGGVANVLWATIDGIGFYLTGTSINNIVFSGYIERNNMHFGMLSLILETGFRTTGLGIDPAHIGYIAPIVVWYGLYKKRKLYVLLGLASIVFAQSTTAIFCVGIILLIDFKSAILKSININKKLLLEIFTFCFLFLFGLFIFRDKLFYSSNCVIGKFFSRISSVYLNKSGISLMSSEPRMYHIVRSFQAMANAKLLLLFGTGFGTMSYAYTMGSNNLLDGLLAYRGKAYDIDTTYLSYLFDTGIIGLALYIYILLKTQFYYRKQIYIKDKNAVDFVDVFIYYAIFCLIITHFTYHYILFSIQILLIIVSLNRICYKRKVM